jgi:hypothetical protein
MLESLATAKATEDIFLFGLTSFRDKKIHRLPDCLSR